MGIFDGYLIISDFDGTFATKTEPVEKNLPAVRYFTENGGRFTVTNANDSSEWISFRTYMYPNGNLNQITCGITTSSGYSNNWWMAKYAGSEHVGGYGVNLYEGGIYNATAANAQNITYETLGLSNSFTSGIVTVTSTTGIQFSFSNLGYSL